MVQYQAPTFEFPNGSPAITLFRRVGSEEALLIRDRMRADPAFEQHAVAIKSLIPPGDDSIAATMRVACKTDRQAARGRVDSARSERWGVWSFLMAI